MYLKFLHASLHSSTSSGAAGKGQSSRMGGLLGVTSAKIPDRVEMKAGASSDSEALSCSRMEWRDDHERDTAGCKENIFARILTIIEIFPLVFSFISTWSQWRAQETVVSTDNSKLIGVFVIKITCLA